MGYANQAGIGVNNYYGARDTGSAVGLEHGEDSLHRLNITLTPAFLNGTFVPPVVIPKGALFRSATLRVDEAFTITGTSPTVIIGALSSESTNGIVLTEAELENVGTKVPASTGTGTWAQGSSTGTTAAAKVGKTLGGTSPVVSGTAGKAVLTLTFYNKTKV